MDEASRGNYGIQGVPGNLGGLRSHHNKKIIIRRLSWLEGFIEVSLGLYGGLRVFLEVSLGLYGNFRDFMELRKLPEVSQGLGGLRGLQGTSLQL